VKPVGPRKQSLVIRKVQEGHHHQERPSPERDLKPRDGSVVGFRKTRGTILIATMPLVDLLEWSQLIGILDLHIRTRLVD